MQLWGRVQVIKKCFGKELSPAWKSAVKCAIKVPYLEEKNGRLSLAASVENFCNTCLCYTIYTCQKWIFKFIKKHEIFWECWRLKEDILSLMLSLIVYVRGKVCFLLFWKSFVIQQNNSHLPLGVKSIKWLTLKLLNEFFHCWGRTAYS